VHISSRLVEGALDSLPQNFAVAFVTLLRWLRICRRTSHHRSRAAKAPAFGSLPWRARDQTKKSIFDLPTGPDHIVLYQKNIERRFRGDERFHVIAVTVSGASPPALPPFSSNYSGHAIHILGAKHLGGCRRRPLSVHPTLVISVTEPRDDDHRSPSSLVRAYLRLRGEASCSKVAYEAI
jgi:hypothetical protein